MISQLAFFCNEKGNEMKLYHEENRQLNVFSSFERTLDNGTKKFCLFSKSGEKVTS